jgi:leader peptidase (prepilin peptidase)/N-methyltransferase
VLVTLFIASLAGALVGGAQRVLFKTRKVPFGPYLALGAYVQVLWGPAIVRWYVGTVLGLA